ncbi:MAG: glycosyltransferase family 9 protein [Alphaproteobacteria bacterium]|nr:glycosyltransferase family 9 protein [Alphaproteobacteria bacterium]
MTTPLALPESPKILCFLPHESVEDGLARLPYLRALRHAFPGAHLTWMVGRGPSMFRGPLQPLAKGLIDRVVDSVPIQGRLLELLGRPLAQDSFDLVLDGQQRVMTAMALKRIRTRHFLSAAGDYMLSTRKPAGRASAATTQTARGIGSTEIAQLLALVELATGLPARPAAPLALSPDVRAAARALLPRGPSYVGLAPGAADLSLAWPVNDYVHIARVLAENGNAPVFFLGPAEQHWHEPIGAAVPSARFPVQHASVEHLAAAPDLCIALAERVGVTVVNDGVFAYLAAAAGTPVVGLYGPTDPERTKPLASRLTVLRAQDYGSAELSAIPASKVLQAIAQALVTEGRSRAS